MKYYKIKIKNKNYELRDIQNDFIRDSKLPTSAATNIMCGLKYIIRCDKANKLLQDLSKAKVYLTFALNRIKEIGYEDIKLPSEYNFVEKPNHYQISVNGEKIEVIDLRNDFLDNFIADKGIARELGEVLKYIFRAGKKENTSKDLLKAIDCLDNAIKIAEKI